MIKLFEHANQTKFSLWRNISVRYKKEFMTAAQS